MNWEYMFPRSGFAELFSGTSHYVWLSVAAVLVVYVLYQAAKAFWSVLH